MNSSTPALSGPVLRVRLTVAYDGRGFHGFAANAGVRTVAGDLVAALTRVLRLAEPVELTCAGRTDRGVHALGQVVTFDVPADRDLTEVVDRVNAHVQPEVAVRDLGVVAADFDARHSATSRSYRYVVWNRPEPNPFRSGFAWHVPEPLDIELLHLACDPFIGLHEFGAFCRRATQRDGTPVSLMRRVRSAPPGRRRHQECCTSRSPRRRSATRWCGRWWARWWRSGWGDATPANCSASSAARTGRSAGQLAPPDGLYLLSVGYDAT